MHAMRASSATTSLDHRIAELARRQDGVVSREQLVRLGLTRSAIEHRVRSGRLHRIHTGVYAVGHRALSARGRSIAALLAAGEGAVLSHATALSVWDLSQAGGGPVHVTVAGDNGRSRRPGLVVHRSRTLSPADVVRRDGLPVTSARRTIGDARRSVSPQRFAAMVRRAEILRLDVGAIRGFEERPIEEDGIRTRMDAIIRRWRLPAPRREVIIDAYTVDYLWEAQHLVVETDGRRTHDITSAFESDRARDARLAVLGFQTLRFTWRQITREPDLVGWTLATVLQTRGA